MWCRDLELLSHRVAFLLISVDTTLLASLQPVLSKAFDTNGDGKIAATELADGALAYIKSKDEAKLYKRLTYG